MPDAGAVALADPQHIFVRAGVPNRTEPSAVLRQGRLAVAFASDARLAVAVESADGTMTARDAIELDVTWPVHATLVATAGGYELVWTTSIIDQPLRLQRAMLDEEGRLVAGPTTLRERWYQMDCDAAVVAGKLLVACSEHEGGDVADLVTMECDLGQTSCELARQEARCMGRLSRPAILEDATGVYLFYGCDDANQPGLYRATVGGGTEPIALLSTEFVWDGPAALADGDRHVVAWLGSAHVFDRSGAEVFPPFDLYPLDGGDAYGDAPWEVTRDEGGYLFAGTPFVAVFERGHGEVRFCRVDHQWSGVSCEPVSTELGSATLATDASRSEIVFEANSLSFTTDLVRVTVDPNGPPRPPRPLLQPFGDLFLQCGACDAHSCDVLTHQRTLRSLTIQSEYAWLRVSRTEAGVSSPGPAVATEQLYSNVSCNPEGAVVPWVSDDGTCNVGWLDRNAPVTWSTPVDPCGYKAFAEGSAVRVLSSLAPKTQQLIVDAQASPSAPVGQAGDYVVKCGSAYFDHDTATGALVLRRWRPEVDTEFEVILEYRPAHTVDFARVYCDDATTVLILSGPENHEVRALVEGPEGFDLARWDADPARLDWQHALVHRGRLFIEEPNEDSPSFYIVGPSGAETLSWTPPAAQRIRADTFRAYSDRGLLVATWNGGEVGDAWISIWESR